MKKSRYGKRQGVVFILAILIIVVMVFSIIGPIIAMAL